MKRWYENKFEDKTQFGDNKGNLDYQEIDEFDAWELDKLEPRITKTKNKQDRIQ